MKLGLGRLILLLAATAAAWFWLGRMGGGVTWLKVEAPRHAVAGERLPMRVHVAGLNEPTFLCVDLHWSSVRDASNGYLASGGAKPVGKQSSSLDFEIMVRTTNGLHYVHGIIYLSSSASWTGHTFVATTDLIPVTSGHDGKEPGLVRVPVHPLLESRARENMRPSAIPRLMTGLLLLAASVVAWMVFRSVSSFRETSSPEHRWWLASAVALTLACIWELSGQESWVGSQARAWARAEDFYYPRALFQKGIISLTIAATLVFLTFAWRKRKSYQLPLFFFGLYLALSVINLLSFHSIDRYAGLSWRGITLIEALKFVCATAALKCVWQAKQ